MTDVSIDEVGKELTKGDRANAWAIFSHLSILFLPILGPIISLIVAGKNEFIARHSKEALNLQLTYIAGLAILGIISLVLMMTLIGILLIPVIALAYFVIMIYWIISVIKAAIEANKGEAYTYKFVFRLFK